MEGCPTVQRPVRIKRSETVDYVSIHLFLYTWNLYKNTSAEILEMRNQLAYSKDEKKTVDGNSVFITFFSSPVILDSVDGR